MNAQSRSRRRLALGTVTLITVVITCLISTTARADAPGGSASTDGGLLLHGKGVTGSLPAIRLGTDMDVTVTGQIARVRVTQAFRNTSDQWMEATYLYPLPDDGAVDSLKMVVGQRVFIGRIKPREEARAIYQRALEEGRQAGLTESERPNLFRNQIANIGPRETVLVTIEFQAPVRQLGGEFALRLPLVAGPRYVPPRTLDSAAALADAVNVTAPLAHPALGTALNPVSITVHLSPGFVPANVISPYHPIAVREAGHEQRTITLSAGQVPADRDFELRWRSASADPTVALFRQSFAGQDHVMAVVTPPPSVPAATIAPREMIFVIDNSGSMGGESMRAAKESLLNALATLRSHDSFNVIRFDDTMTLLFDQPTLASAEQLAVARHFAQGLEASGGTEMLPALKAALVDPAPASAGLRQVVFLTDGDLSNEREMMAEIAANAGRSRVFMVGIGSAPNTFLMRRMAEAGRGTYTQIAVEREVTTKMAALLERLKTPAVQDLAVTVDGTALDLAPRRLPDLYAGEPLVLLGRGEAAATGKITVSGRIAGKAWQVRLDLGKAEASQAIARLWAGRRIADIEAQRWSDEIGEEAADAAIQELGMAYGMVTTRTSLIAQDETPRRPAGARLTREELPLLLPAGWDFDTLMGNDPLHRGDTADAAGAARAAQDEPLALPQTATGFADRLLHGLALLAAGLAGLLASSSRRFNGRRLQEYRA